jgi:D-beta-D-heptose 7-phosphate kinase/D-beta-D-heptose 1-phosphate adenosyltransferase
MMNQSDHIESKILNPDQKGNFISGELRKGRKIVFTNGCFDILHPGHFHLLTIAKEMGALLVVGLNSDDSVRRLKGSSRPVNDQKKRASQLASLDYVDFVVMFTEDTPEKLIQRIKPDILVKGGDYKENEIIGSDFVLSYGGIVTTIPLLEGFSTTQLIDKSKKR